MADFQIVSDFKPAGDQQQAIDALVSGINNHDRHQTLLGITGSGKTFTMANVIEKVQKPTLIISHNKTKVKNYFQLFFLLLDMVFLHSHCHYVDIYNFRTFLFQS